MDRPPLGNTGCEPLTEMYWSGNEAGPGWEVIERNPAPYYTGMTIRRVTFSDDEIETIKSLVYDWGFEYSLNAKSEKVAALAKRLGLRYQE